MQRLTRILLYSRLAIPKTRPVFARSLSTQSNPKEHRHNVPGIVSGAPETFLTRKVRIFRRARNPSQQGPQPEVWMIDFTRGDHWVNPLMGWTSSSDSSSQITGDLTFHSKEAAVAYAERQGFEIAVLPEHKPVKKPKSYSDNYKFKGAPPQ